MKYSRIAIPVFTFAALAITISLFKLPTTAAAADKSPFAKNFSLISKTGEIAKPRDYREKYETWGSYFVLDPAGNQMHMTYASLGAAAYYRQNGKFADGTVLVKEVFGTDHAQMTTGDAHFAKDTKVWFVMVKDGEGRNKESKFWGDGWEWSLYKSDTPDKQVAVSYKHDCQGCHIPALKTDSIYVQGYPVLKSAN